MLISKLIQRYQGTLQNSRSDYPMRFYRYCWCIYISSQTKTIRKACCNYTRTGEIIS